MDDESDWVAGLKDMADRLARGDRSALLDAIVSSVSRDPVMPDELRRAILSAIQSYQFDHVSLLAEAFGIERPRLEARRRRWLVGYVCRLVEEQRAVTGDLDEAIGNVAKSLAREKLGGLTWGETTVRNLYYPHKSATAP